MSATSDKVAYGNEDTIEKFGADIRALIRRTGLSEREVCRRTNTPASTLSGWLGGRNLMSKAFLEAILTEFKVRGKKSWISRWEALKSAPAKPARPKTPDLGEIVTRAVDIERVLPSGSKVRVVIEIDVP